MTVVPETRPKAPLTGLIVLGLLVAMVFGVIAVRYWWPQAIVDTQTMLLALRAHGRHAWLVFLLLQTLIALSGVVPTSVVGLAAGAVYGPLVGMVFATASTLAAAGIAFGIARSALRPTVAALLARRCALQRIDRAVSAEGWRMVCLLRISPVMPFAMTSYALGLTGLSLHDYMLGTLASLPALACYVALGWLGALGVDAHGQSALQWTLLVVGVIATIVLAWHIGRMLRRALT